MCRDSQPSNLKESTYQPLKRWNSFRSAQGLNDRSTFLHEKARILQEMQANMQRLNEMETYENKVKGISQPLSEFERTTGWTYKQGCPLSKDDPVYQNQVAAAHQNQAMAQNPAAARPPIPPPIRMSSLTRGTEDISILMP
jgi:hypothetical protein